LTVKPDFAIILSVAMTRIYCADLSTRNIGEDFTLSGWVHSRRDHGGLIFIDLRDRTGVIQLVADPQLAEIFSLAEKLHNEDVIRVHGTIRQRPPGTENPNLLTGQIELVVKKIEILNSAQQPLPLEISDYVSSGEDNRLRYRYLDLRRPAVQKNFIFRHRLTQIIRNFLDREKFLEIETPFLTRSTPEGARDFLVPSRLNPGSFYALPQSPQLFKQLLMVAGFDRYFQIVRCFRDEDLRADRQPEFTQLDLEMSFIEEEDLIRVVENLLAEIFEQLLDQKITRPLPRLTYQQAIARYGCDRPDTRFGLEIVDLTPELTKTEFKIFAQAIAAGGVIRAINASGATEKFSRSEIDRIIEKSQEWGAKGLAWMKFSEQEVESSIVKFFTRQELDFIRQKTSARAGDIVFFCADQPGIVATVLGNLRNYLINTLAPVPKEKYSFVWITDFPLLVWDSEERRWSSEHHPFTAPTDESWKIIQEKVKEPKNFSDPQSFLGLNSRAYDIVLNGIELGGGSIRIHQIEKQQTIFQILGISSPEAEEKFGFLLEALRYGAPPHGGIALGLDRLTALLLGADSIREVIAFPKTQKAICPLTRSPAPVSNRQLKELHIKIRE